MPASAASVTSTGTVLSAGCTVLAVQFRAGATAGSVVLKDGGASGTAKLTIYTPASATFAGFVTLADGIVFGTDVHATLTQADGVTVIYRANP